MFLANRHETWFSHSKSILSIIIIDFLDGLSTLVWFLFSLKENINKNACLTSMALALASQTAASLNILRFCATRLHSVRSTSFIQEQTPSKVILQTIMIWLVSSVLILIPLTFWSVREPVLKRCRWRVMFVSNETRVDLYMFNVIAVPTMVTTVLYGILLRRLRKAQNLVQPMGKGNTKHNTLVESKPQTVGNETLFLSGAYRTRRVPDNVDKQGSASSREIETDKATPQKAGGHSSTVTTKTADNVANNKKSGNVTDNMRQSNEPSYGLEETAISSYHRVIKRGTGVEPRPAKDNLPGDEAPSFSTVRNTSLAATESRGNRMAKVIAILGLLLVLINISNLPFTVILLIKAINPEKEVCGTAAALSLFFLMINSACNGIVHAVRIKPLRTAILKTLRDARSALSKLLCCNA